MIAMRRRRDPLNHGPTQTITEEMPALSVLVCVGPWLTQIGADAPCSSPNGAP